MDAPSHSSSNNTDKMISEKTNLWIEVGKLFSKEAEFSDIDILKIKDGFAPDG
jgi:hypothetical protein